MTDVDRRRLIAYNNIIYSFLKKIDCHKMLWLLCWNITSHRSKQLVIGNVQDDGSQFSRGPSGHSLLIPEHNLVESEAVEMI